ncbi:MAG TPA: bifunctional phosphoglucose/phosphomannose isomerase [Patescibacteria group bacterium]|nr:bifunctional phosphoglucose/phosphomannose isomerase [Patescibacteria group bacterium]
MPKAAITLENIKKLDTSGMLGLLEDLPSHCRASLDIVAHTPLACDKREFKNIVFAGLGGSAIGADLVRTFLYEKCRIPIAVVREYGLPAYVDSASLVFIASYSGNTEETLSAYAAAQERGATVIAVTSGGALKEQAGRDKVTCVQVPGGLPPRCSLGYQSIIPLCMLSKMGLIENMEAYVGQTAGLLEDMQRQCLSPRIGQKDNIAKYTAAKLYNKFAFIYSASVHFDAVVTRWRGQLAENAKTLASSHLFPEMNHNEIMGWQHPGRLLKDFTVVMLRDKGMHPRVAARMDITGKIIAKDGTEVLEVWSRGDSLLSRIFSLIYIGDFVSFYLAILYGTDPTPVERITDLKNRLAKI